jgi:hypothetical protein
VVLDYDCSGNMTVCNNLLLNLKIKTTKASTSLSFFNQL